MTQPTTTEFNALQARISRVFEIGDGDYGYGQVALSQQLGETVPAELLDFQNLRTDILAAKQHQVGVLTTLPITPITNTITSTQWAAFSTVLAQVETNRLATPPAAQAARDIMLANSITTEWNGTSVQTVTVSFNSADDMRFYFNTGSSIEFSAARTAGANNTKNTSWTSLLTSIGVVSFKRNATTSTKVVGTSIGYSKLTDTRQMVFQKVTSDTLKPNSYTIYARMPDDATLEFQIEFADGSTSLSDPNVSGTLTSTVTAFHASGVFVSVPAPIAVGSFDIGTPNPTFLLTRDATSIGEGQTGVTFTVTTVNFQGDTLYWRATGYGITASDFVENTLQDQFSIVDGVGSFSLTAAADLLTEGTEKFVVEIRTESALTSPVVASISASPETITDLSLTVPVVVTNPSYNFVSQNVSSVNEGQTVSFTIVTTGVPDGTQLVWSTKGLTAGITAADFEDNTLTGTVVIFNNTATIDRTLINDNSVEAVESFQIILSTIDSKTGFKKQVAISYLMQVIDTVVVVPDVPYVVANSISSTAEGSTVGITFKITTPKLPLNTRLYWQTFSDVGTLTTGDFNDNAVSGSVLITNQVGTVIRYAKADSLTEGLESFHLVFYSDPQMTTELVQSNSVSITEAVNYTITRTPGSMEEGGTGVTFTVNTPKLDDGTILYWTTVSEAGTVTESDFVDNVLEGTVTINQNTGTILRRATKDSIVEGLEQFHLEIRATQGVSGPILVSSQSTSITENVDYQVLSQGSEIREGSVGVDFVVKTPMLPAGTILYWSTVTDTGNITSSDFTDNRISGTVTITNNIGTITRTAASDGLTEGDESFHLVLRTGSASGTQVAVSDVVTISEYVRYSITASTQTITEGGAGVTFNITTPKVPNGTVLYWTTLANAGNITQDDFIVSDAAGGSAQRLSGQVVVQNNRASFIIAGRNDGITEGTETFQIELRLDSATGPVQDTSALVSLAEIVPYQVIAGTDSITEGPGSVSVTFTVRTPVLPDGTLLYWTTRTASGAVNGNDFSDGVTQGTVKIVGNTGTIIRTAKADATTEGVEAFSIELRASGYDTPVITTSGVVVIQDTSLTVEVPEPDAPTYAVTIDGGVSSIIKGGNVTFVVATTNVSQTDNLFWTVFRGPGLSATDFVTANSPSAIHVDNTGHVGVTVTTIANDLVQGIRSFIFELRTGSIYGPVVATSPTAVSITDEAKYMISASTRSIAESNNGSVTFTVTTPSSGYGKTLSWSAVANTGTITNGDFDEGASGTVSINNSGTGSFTLHAAADGVTEGNESFHIELADGSTPIVLGAASPVVTIAEVVNYTLTVNTTSISEGGSGAIFTLTTPKLNSDTAFNYTIVGKTGSITAGDFNPQSLTGSVTVSSSTNTGTFTVTARGDGVTEGNESFYITLTSATGQSITLGSDSPVVTITESVNYVMLANNSTNGVSVAEGSAVTFTVNTPSLPDNTTLYWNVVQDSGNITTDDFVEGTLSGPVTIKNNTGTIVLTHKDDKVTEGSESYHLTLRENSIQGNLLDVVSPTVTITESVGYTLTSNVTAITEGTSVIFTVTTPKLTDGTVLNYQINSLTEGRVVAQDFTSGSLTGTVTINNNTGTFTLTAVTDSSSEPDDSFNIILSLNGTVVIMANASPIIKISDSSAYSLTSNVTTISEGGAGVTFSIVTPAVSTEKNLYWSVKSESGSVVSTDLSAMSGTVAISNHIGTFTITAKTDQLLNEGDTFSIVLKTGSQTGTALQLTSPVISITDTEFYTIVADKTSIDEGGAPVTFTITTPTADNGSVLYWKIVGGTNVTQADFDPQTLSSQTAAVSNKTATVVITAAADLKTEGTETFILQVAKSLNGTPIVFKPVCPTITINDTSTKQSVVNGLKISVDQGSATSIKEGNYGTITARIEPNTNAGWINSVNTFDVAWKIKNPTNNVTGYIGTKLSSPFTSVTSGTIKSVWNGSNPSISLASLTLWIDKVATAASGGFQVEFTIIDPITKNPVVALSNVINIAHNPVTLSPITATQSWQIPTNTDQLSITLFGGGGSGAGAGAVFAGGNGGDAGTVVVTLDAASLRKDGVKDLCFSFIPGGTSKPGVDDKDNDTDDIYDWGGAGGNGGAGIALYIGSAAKGTPLCTVGGAGGGGGGRLSGTSPGGNGGNGIAAPSTTWAASYGSAGVNSTQSDGAGGGGGSTAVTQSPAYDTSYSTMVSRAGGNSGVSWIPSPTSKYVLNAVFNAGQGGKGGNGVQLVNASSTYVIDATYPATEVGKTVDTIFVNNGITTTALNKSQALYITWSDVNLSQGNYTITVLTDGLGAVVINGVIFNAQSRKIGVTPVAFSIPNGWDRKISVMYKYVTNKYNTDGIAVIIQQVVNGVTTKVWSSKYPGAKVRPTESAGDAGQPAKVMITYTPK